MKRLIYLSAEQEQPFPAAGGGGGLLSVFPVFPLPPQGSRLPSSCRGG